QKQHIALIDWLSRNRVGWSGDGGAGNSGESTCPPTRRPLRRFGKIRTRRHGSPHRRAASQERGSPFSIGWHALYAARAATRLRVASADGATYGLDRASAFRISAPNISGRTAGWSAAWHSKGSRFVPHRSRRSEKAELFYCGSTVSSAMR